MIPVALLAFIIGFICGSVFVMRSTDKDGNIIICSRVDIQE